MSEAKDADVDRLTLLPCPFCGEPPREHYGENSKEHWVACDSESCDVCPTTSGGSIESARRAWNRRQSLSQEAVREEQVARAANVIAASPLIDHPKLPSMNWRGLARQILEVALKREPNAAAQAILTGSEAPHMPLAGQAASSHRPTAEPAPAAPDVESMVKRLESEAAYHELHGFIETKLLLRQAAALLAKLGQQVETLQAAHDLGWAHKTCPNCGAAMMTGASDD